MTVEETAGPKGTFLSGRYTRVADSLDYVNSPLRPEVGYLHGFQRDSERTYAPRYLVLALGWQVAL